MHAIFNVYISLSTRGGGTLLEGYEFACPWGWGRVVVLCGANLCVAGMFPIYLLFCLFWFLVGSDETLISTLLKI